MQIKATMGCHLTPVKMSIIVQTRHKSQWGCEEKATLLNVGENINWYSHMANSMGYSRNLK